MSSFPPHSINKKLSCLDAVKRQHGKVNRPAVHSIAIVHSCRDRSGSMCSFGQAAGVALYDMIEEQRKNSEDNNVEVIFSLTTFDHEVQCVIVNENIQNVAISSDEALSMVLPRGTTRLIATAIEELAKLRKKFKSVQRANPDSKVIGVFELFTDGDDNESVPLTAKDLNIAVRAARAEGITCIFAGANQDAVNTGQKYGFQTDTCLTMSSAPTRGGTGLRACSQAVARVVSGGSANFTPMERHSSAPPQNSFNTPPSTPPSTPPTVTMQGLAPMPLRRC